jgi:hypothetical protein
LFIDNPKLAQTVFDSAGARTEFQRNDLAEFGFQLEQSSGDPQAQQQLIQQRVQNLTAQGRDPSDTAALLQADPKRRAQFARTVQLAALNNAERLEIAQRGKKGLASAKTEFLPGGGSLQALPSGEIIAKDEQGRVATGQARQDLLDRSRDFQLELAQGKSDIRIAEDIEKSRGKAGVDLRFKPAIQAAVKLAEEEARAQGETLTTLKRAEAALPGLLETVETLKQLAPIATSTLGGKVFDTVVKESGFGATEGATARAKFIAIVANQVLPLLRDTFGAAFTKAEGDELKATMGDPDASPAQKIAQLEAFITQKRRSIETSEREVAPPPATTAPPAAPPSGRQGGTLNVDAAGNRAFVFPDGTFEEVS